MSLREPRRGPESKSKDADAAIVTAVVTALVVDDQNVKIPEAEDMEATPGNEAVEGEQQPRTGQGRSRRGRRGGRRRGGNRNREGGENTGAEGAEGGSAASEAGGEHVPQASDSSGSAPQSPPPPVFHETPRPFEASNIEAPRAPVSNEPPVLRTELLPRHEDHGASVPAPQVETKPREDNGASEPAPKPPVVTPSESSNWKQCNRPERDHLTSGFFLDTVSRAHLNQQSFRGCLDQIQHPFESLRPAIIRIGHVFHTQVRREIQE